MPFSFPSSPTVGQTSTQNGRVYRWSGSAWEFASVSPAEDARWSLFAPPPPTSLTATPGNAQASLSWIAPTVLAQTPITDYIVQYSANSGSSWTTFSDGTSTSTSATVTGLTNGTAYTFRVAAVNGIGAGSYSTASSSVTPSGAPPVLLLVRPTGNHGDSPLVDNGPGSLTLTGDALVTQYYGDAVAGYRSGVFGDWRAVFFGGRTLGLADLSLGTSDFTFETWAVVAGMFGYSPNRQLFGNSAFSFQVGVGDNNGRIRLLVSGTEIAASSNDAINIDAYTHIALVRSGSAIRLYSAGNLVASGTTGASFSGTGMIIGTFGGGFMSNIRISAAALYSGSTYTIPTPPL